MSDKIRKSIKESIIVVALYITCVVIRFISGCYLKKIHVYADDLYYYQIAQGFFRGFGITIHNAPIQFQKVLYSLLISPAFFVQNDLARCLLIQLINSAVISSAIFPIWQMSRKMINSRRKRILICGLFLLYPDLCYSQTFVTENVFFPASLWIAYVYIELLTRKKINRIGCSVLLGIFVYLVYITKGSCTLFILPVMMATAFCDIIIEKNDLEIKERIKNRVMELILIYSTFFASRFIGKLLFVQTPGVTADIKKTVSIISIESIFVEIKLYIYMLAVYIVAAGILGAFFPGLYFKQLKFYTKRVYCYASMALLAVPLFTAHFFSFMYGIEKASAHLRYGMYLFPMLLLSVASMSEDVKNRITQKNIKILFFIGCTLVAVFLVGVYNLSMIDQTLTWYITRIFNDRMWIYKLVVIMVGISVPFLFEKYGNLVLKVFCLVFVLIMICNNVLVIKYHYQDYSVNRAEYVEICAIRDFVRDNPDASFLAITEIPSEFSRMVDTFCNEPNMYCVMDWDKKMNDYSGTTSYERGILVSPEGYHYDVDSIEYMLIPRELGVSILQTDGEVVSGYGGTLFEMYRIYDPIRVPTMVEYRYF